MQSETAPQNHEQRAADQAAAGDSPELCPRCKEAPISDSQTICGGCQADEDAEARAGEEDSRTAADARRAEQQEQQRPAQRQQQAPPPQQHRRGQPAQGAQSQQQAQRPQQQRPSSGRAAHPDQARPPAPQQQRQAPPPSAGGQALERGKSRPAPAPRSSVDMAPTVGMEHEPEKLVFYGPGGVGKSTLVASIPDVVMICMENTPGLTVPRFDKAKAPRTLQQFSQIIAYLRTAEHPYKTLAIDSADALEALIFKAVVERANQRHEEAAGVGEAENIEHVGKGYKKGYVAATAKWLEVLADLDQLRIQREMRIVFTGHDVITKRFNPAGDDFDRYEIALHPDAGRQVLYNWADAVLLCNYVTKTMKQGKRGKAKGIGGKERAMYTTNADAYQAKNRFDLPEQMPLDFGALVYAIEQWQSPKLLMQAIEDALAVVGDLVVDVKGTPYTIRDLTEAELARNPPRQKLAQLKNRLEARVADVEAQREAEEAQAGGAE